MAQLNETAKQNLIRRRSTAALQYPTEFSIIFLGDPHVGMNHRTDGTGCGTNNTPNYTALLRSINSTDKSLIAVFNGGDGADNSNYIPDFVKFTSAEMIAKTVKNIPFFAAVGNHEYIGNPSLSVYKQYISNVINDVIPLYGPTTSGTHAGPRVAVIMLDTGGPDTDGCRLTSTGRSGALIKQSIDQIESNKVFTSAIKETDIKFIIDMHIPPNGVIDRVSPPPMNLITGDGTHVLCPDAERHFHAFVNRIVQSATTNRILAFVTHHRHGLIQGVVDNNFLYFNRPVFLTAQGGNCDPAPRSMVSYYKFYFRTQTPKSRNNYVINRVFRITVNTANGTILSQDQIY